MAEQQARAHLLPCGIIPLLDGHRWRLEGGQNDVVGRGQLNPDVIGAATVCSGGKPREDRTEGGHPCFRRLALGTAPTCKSMTASRLCTPCVRKHPSTCCPSFPTQEKGVSLKTKMAFYEDVVFPSGTVDGNRAVACLELHYPQGIGPQSLVPVTIGAGGSLGTGNRKGSLAGESMTA